MFGVKKLFCGAFALLLFLLGCSQSNQVTERKNDENVFFLPEVELQQVSLKTAVGQLQEEYRRVGRETLAEDATLSIVVPKSDELVSLQTGTISVSRALLLLGAQTDRELVKGSRGYRLRLVSPNKKKVTRVMTVFPSLPSDLKTMTGGEASKNLRKGADVDLKMLFSKLGFQLDSAQWVYRTSELTISGAQSEVRQVGSFIDYLAENSVPLLVRVMQKLFVVRGESEIKEGLYSKDEFALLSRRIAGERGNGIYPLPSELIRSGESVPLEQSKRGRDWDRYSSDGNWTGDRGKIRATMYGAGGRCKVNFNYGFLRDRKTGRIDFFRRRNEGVVEEISPTKSERIAREEAWDLRVRRSYADGKSEPLYAKVNYTKVIPNDYTFLKKVGRNLYYALTVEKIDATGRPLL